MKCTRFLFISALNMRNVLALIYLVCLPAVLLGQNDCRDAVHDPANLKCVLDVNPTTFLPMTDGTAYISVTDATQTPYSTFLYPSNSNDMPALHRSKGQSIAAGIVPLDVNGNPDVVNGKIKIIAEGPSNQRDEMDKFFELHIDGNAALHPNLEFENLAVGSCDLVCWADGGPGAVDPQVQIAFVKHTNNRKQNQDGSPLQANGYFNTAADKSFPNHAQTTKSMLKTRILDLKIKYPNLKIVYLTSRSFGGWSCDPSNDQYREPVGYEEGFSVKWLVEDQTLGNDPDLAFEGANPQAPWIAWGPYLWDPATPQDHMKDDGVHPCETGQTVIADKWYDFLTNDNTAAPWFLDANIDAPSGLTAMLNGATTIDLSWTDNSNNEDGFTIERKEGNGAFVAIASVGAGVQTYIDSGLQESTSYTYRVRAFNAQETSSFSNEAAAATPGVPTAPENLIALAAANDQIDLSWTDNVGNEDNFKIERHSGDGNFVEIATTAANVSSYNDAGLTPGATYTYRVFAMNAQGNSGFTNEASATTPTQTACVPNGNNLALNQATTASSVDPPDNPEDATDGNSGTLWRSDDVNEGTPEWLKVDFGATVQVDSVFIGWESKDYAEVYEVQLSDDDLNWTTAVSATKSDEGDEIHTFALTSARYMRIWMTQNRKSTYKVYELEAYGCSGDVINAPAAPSALTATKNATTPDSRIDLVWTDNADNENGFKIERHNGDGNFVLIASVAAGVTTFSDFGLDDGTTYTYRLSAYNGAGDSGLSNEASASTDLLPPDAPSDFTAIANGVSQINLSWTDNADSEDGFKIERHGGDGNFVEIAAVGPDVTTYNDTGLSASTTFTYRIAAYNAAGNSVYAGPVSATTNDPPNPPAAPSTLTATAISDTQIDLTWTDNANNENGFKVERHAGDGNFVLIATLAANVTSYSNTGLSASTTYTYRIFAFNDDGDSGFSNEAAATTAPPPPPPAAPSGLTAIAASSSQIDLSWTDNSGDETGFKIERHAGDGNFAEIATVGADVTAFNDTGLNPSATYTYRVRAYNGGGDSGYSNSANATTFPPPPAAPSGLTAVAVSSSQIDLSWTDNSGDEDGFKIERHAGDGNFVEIATVGADVVSFNDSGLNPATTYTYQIRAHNASGNSAYAGPAAATTQPLPPADPANLAATANGASQIDLSWDDNSANEDGFKIERHAGDGNFAEIATVGAGVTSYNDTGLSASTSYTYRVRAHNTGGNSGYSNEASATTATPPPAAPSNLAATANGTSQIDLTWTDNSNDEDGFKIERHAGDGNFVEIANLGADVTSFNDSGLNPGTTYTYQIRAFNSGGNSTYDGPVSETTTPLPPADPDNLTATANGGFQVDLTWNDNANNEDGFSIERHDGDGSFAEIAVVGANVTSYNDTGLNSNATYTYRVRAFNNGGESNYAGPASATTTASPPDAPTALTATTIGSQQIDLAWTDNADNEDGFKIESHDGDGNFTEIAVVGANVTMYNDIGLTETTTYTYRVRAFNNDGDSNFSNEASATTDQGGCVPSDDNIALNQTTTVSSVDPPDNAENATDGDDNSLWRSDDVRAGTPEWLKVDFGQTATFDSVMIGFEDKDYAEVFEIQTSDDDANWTTVVSATKSDEGDEHFGFAPVSAQFVRIHMTQNRKSTYKIYEFEVFGCFGGGASQNPPSAPSGLNATANGVSQIDLAWFDNAGDESGFKIERHDGDGNFAEVAVVGTNSTSFNDTGLNPATTYTYRVRAYNMGGNSGYTNQSSATTATPAPDAPSGAAAVAVGSDRIDLTWVDNSDNEDGFKIERHDGDGNFVEIAGVGANVSAYNDLGLNSGATYTYRVRAHNVGGNSNYSNQAAATTDEVPPAAPSALSATANGTSQIDLSWADNANNEDGFKIERHAGDGNFVEIATVGANVSSFNNSGLSASTTYTYRVRAHNAAGNSNYSNEAAATTEDPPTPPAAPTSLTATANGASQIDLSWTDNASDEDGFKIERHAGDGNFTEIASVGANVTAFSSTGLNASTTYTFRVRAHNAGGNSGYSNEVSATTATPPPSAPSSLNATANGTTQIDLTWTDNSNNEDGFKIERHSGDGNFAEIASVGANVASFSDTGLNPSTTYTYRVRSFNASGNSGFSNEASATTGTPAPAAPTSLTATANGAEQIDLSWTDNANIEAGFKIERHAGDGNFVEIATVGANVTAFSSTGLSASTTYTFRVRAHNAGGNSGYSNEASATTAAPPPAAPSSLAATANGTSQIDLTWTDNSNNEDGFKIERHAGDGNFAEIASVGANVASFSDAGLNSSTTYTYRVRSFNASGNSGFSNEASATTGTPIPAAPTSLTATANGADQIDLSWTDNANNEDGFKIERHDGDGNFVEIASVSADVASYNDAGLSANTTYTYRVFAHNAGGNSGFSNEASATTEGDPVDPNINLGLNKPITASSTHASFVAANGNDGSTGSAWGTQTGGGDEWLRIDLETTQTVGRAIVRWSSTRFATNYQFQISDDDVNWTTVHTTSAGASGFQEFLFTATTARYVRLLMTAFNQNQLAVEEFEVYAGASESVGKPLTVNGELNRSSVYSSQFTVHSYALHQNYPNPFNPSTTIAFDLPEDIQVTLALYDYSGREVVSLVRGENFRAGRHEIRFNAGDLHSGVYIMVLRAGSFQQSRKLILMK